MFEPLLLTRTRRVLRSFVNVLVAKPSRRQSGLLKLVCTENVVQEEDTSVDEQKVNCTKSPEIVCLSFVITLANDAF